MLQVSESTKQKAFEKGHDLLSGRTEVKYKVNPGVKSLWFETCQG